MEGQVVTKSKTMEAKVQGPQIPVSELPAMAPLHDPIFQQVIRMIPINGTYNIGSFRLNLYLQSSVAPFIECSSLFFLNGTT